MSPQPFSPLLTRLRLAALAMVIAGVVLHAHELHLYSALPWPKRFMAPPYWWSCAPYLVAAGLTCARRQAAAVAFAFVALTLDIAAHYLVYIRPYVPRRFDLPGWPVYFMPGISLFVLGPVAAAVAWYLERRAAMRNEG